MIVNNMGFFMVFIVSSLLIGANCKCNLNEMAVCNSADICFCRACLTCPAGYGLNMECWGRLNKGTAMKCLPCIEDKTYSNENSTSRCQPCPQCDGKRVLQKCTATNPTLCSRTECEVGFEYNPVVDSCEPVATPTPKTTEQPLKTTHQSSPAKPTQSTTDLHENPSRENPTGTLHILQQDKQQPTSDSIQNHSKDSKPNLQWQFIVSLLVAILVIAVTVAIIYYLRTAIKKCLKSKAKKAEAMEMEHLCEGENSPVPPRRQDRPWPTDLLLKDVPYNILRNIQIKICKEDPPGWKIIGSQIGIPNDGLEPVENHSEEKRGQELFVVLKTRKPALTLTKFVEVLEDLKRIDVVSCICEGYQKINDTVMPQDTE